MPIRRRSRPRRHPFHAQGYDFEVRLFQGDHVTEEAGTGFVHTAPGHGADDYELFVKNKKSFEEAGVPEVPHTVGEDGFYFEHVPMFGGKEPKRVINDKGKFGDANDAVIQALIDANALIARGRLKHQYPHSWRSKAPVIFRNTPQWFIALDKPTKVKGVKGQKTIRDLALQAIDDTRFVPATGQNRLRGMTESRPDWVISRQRAWGVPITVFVNETSGEVIPNAEFNSSKELIGRITAAFEAEGADAWFKDGARERFLAGLVADPSEWKKVDDILDVWFESGSTHAFVLEKRKDLGWPAALYLEGSDQHRGWFASSLLESCATRGRAPFDAVLTHGFVLDEKGEEKMSKSKGNTLSPQDVSKLNGSEILRLWVASADYSGDVRFGPGIVQSAVEVLSQAAQHHALPARQSGALFARISGSPMPTCRNWSASCCTGCGSWTAPCARPTRISTSSAYSRRCSISAPATCPRSISTSARTRSIATRLPA